MKLKRGIGVLMCCMTVMGAFSFGGLHTEAALCDHSVLQWEPDAYKTSFHDSIFHYEIYGDKSSCPRCGYVRWENEYTRQVGSHTFDAYGRCSCGYKK